MAKFINPYNFVPLQGAEPVRSSGQEETGEELLTGKIEYTIETLSPLFIPNTSNDRIFGIQGVEDTEKTYHKNYDFFSYHDLSGEKDSEVCYEPVIPGSEIRGAVRSVYEAMTNSCLSSVDENATLSKRTAEHFKPGILQREGNTYRLYEANDYLYRKNEPKDFSVHSFVEAGLPADGSLVCFYSANNPEKDRRLFANSISAAKAGKNPNGYLIKGEPGPELAKSEKGSKCDDCPKATKGQCTEERCYLLEKHCAHVFTINAKKKKYALSKDKEQFEDVSRRMNQLLNTYAKYNSNAYSEYKVTWEQFEKDINKGIAVYYSVVGDIWYLSPACITREVYQNTLKEILGEYHTCNDSKKACPACRLFGAVNGQLKLASGIRFSDARLKFPDDGQREDADFGDFYNEILTLPELAAPKLSSTEFYLTCPDKRAINWTYDYYVLMDESNKVSVKTYTPQIAGRKFYWHSPAAAEWVSRPDVQKLIERNERNRTVRPLRKGVMFEGELYFDKITREQLDGLIRILNISAQKENEGKKGKYALKLGGAKPLGFGSVAMQVTEVVFRTVSFDDKGQLKYVENNQYDYGSVKLEEMPDTKILTLLDTEIVKKEEVHYPHVKPISPEDGKEPEEGFVWFTKNRAGLRYLDKRRGILSSDKEHPDAAPASRKQIVYKSYMQSCETELVEIKPGNPEIGKKYYGAVVDCQNGRVRIRLDNNRMVIVGNRDVKGLQKEKTIQEELPQNTRVEVTYLGQEDGHDIWSCMKQRRR